MTLSQDTRWAYATTLPSPQDLTASELYTSREVTYVTFLRS